jgi:hypothetical protein
VAHCVADIVDASDGVDISSAARGLAGPSDRIRWPQVDALVLKRIDGLAAIAADLIGKFDHLVDPGEAADAVLWERLARSEYLTITRNIAAPRPINMLLPWVLSEWPTIQPKNPTRPLGRDRNRILQSLTQRGLRSAVKQEARGQRNSCYHSR